MCIFIVYIQSSPSEVGLTQSTVSLQSVDTYQSTVDSQLDTQEPICPQLVQCTWDVRKIVPELTSSAW